tara:strand:+ start:1291 stop:1407 length:117 start_codon:yes stop_codon:yes gene_type:complete
MSEDVEVRFRSLMEKLSKKELIEEIITYIKDKDFNKWG